MTDETKGSGTPLVDAFKADWRYRPEHLTPGDGIHACLIAALELAESLERLAAAEKERADKAERERDTYRQMDSEAANYVESVICMRTHFTGKPPYVGWDGLGLALREALDERDNAVAALLSEREKGKERDRDAERYRWLKQQRPQPMWAAIPLVIQAKYATRPLDEDMIDAAIDAALAHSSTSDERPGLKPKH